MGQLAGRVAFVGGSSRGIGAAIEAMRLAVERRLGRRVGGAMSEEASAAKAPSPPVPLALEDLAGDGS